MFAVTNGDLEIVRELIEAGADPLLATSDGRSPLSFAEASSSQGIIDALRTRLEKKVTSEGKADQHKRISNEQHKDDSNKNSRETADIKPTLDNNEAKAEYSKMSKERAMKEKKAREQAKKEQEILYADNGNHNNEEADTKKNKPSSFFSFFGF